MATETRPWTLEDLHRLPDDGNKYELVRGELFVTPTPAPDHELILARLARVLGPFVAAQELGEVFRPRAVVRFEGSEVEPDLMVRQAPPSKTPWDPETRTARIVGQGRADHTENAQIVWSPVAASDALRVSLADVFP